METFSTLLAICGGNSAVTSEFPAQKPVTPSFNVFFDLHLNTRLSKQSWRRWFETLSHTLWRHCNRIFFLNENNWIQIQTLPKSAPKAKIDIITWHQVGDRPIPKLIRRRSTTLYGVRRPRCDKSCDLMTSSNGNIFRVTCPWCGEFIGPWWIRLRKASDAELWYFPWSAPEQRLSERSRRRWFETRSRPLWRHCNEVMAIFTSWNLSYLNLEFQRNSHDIDQHISTHSYL